MQLSLTLSSKQYKYLKAAADLENKTLAAYVLDRALAATAGSACDGENPKPVSLSGADSEGNHSGGRADKSVEEIFNETMGPAAG